MKLYHFDRGRNSEPPDFFIASLADYLTETGRNLSAQALKAKAPAFRKGEHGKPYFDDPAFEGIWFSHSDTKGHAVLCFAEEEIGADCENTKARPGIESRWEAIARRCFTEDEFSYAQTDEGGGADRFFEVWTAKEAYMKYTGNGFSEGFKSFSVFRLKDAAITTGRIGDAPHVVYSVCVSRKKSPPDAGAGLNRRLCD